MDVAGNVLFEAAILAARADNATSSDSSSSSSSSKTQRPPVYKIVGIILAVSSGVFIGVSFVLKKVGLLKANVKYNEEAGEGYGYLKNFYWWAGMTLMIIGEVCNFVAYAFVDAILVTPLGALSVVITTILSAIFLKERLSFVGWIGCFQCIVGSVIIALNAPEQSSVADIQEMQGYVITPGFLSFAGVILVGSAFVALFLGPRYGKKSMMVYLSVCSLVGGLSVVATQGLGSAIIAQINGKAQFNQWFLYVLFAFVVGTLLTEIIYLNKALNLFNAALVTPTYYVYFTSSTIVASAVLFQGFHGSAYSITTVVLGFLVICSGVVLLQLAKSAKDVPDTAVFRGDLDQVRTVAEQEEPEYEPRADTIRGGGAIVRAMSKARTKRQAEEAHRLHDSMMMESIGEDGQYEWDGLRRRKTMSSSGTGSVRRSKTVHPPLGMSYFPDETSEPDSDLHPGFFGRMGRSRQEPSNKDHSRKGLSPVPMSSVEPNKSDCEHVYGLPAGLRRDYDGTTTTDTTYKSPGQHIHWAGQEENDGADSRQSSTSLAPPKPPPHNQRRAFSFQKILHRSSQSNEDDGRPVSRGALSFTSRRSAQDAQDRTEEERLGLVHGGDSTRNRSRGRLQTYEEEDEQKRSDEDEWHLTSGNSSSPEQIARESDFADLGRRRKRDPYTDYDDEDDDLYDAPIQSPNDLDGSGGRSGRGGGGAFV